ncbi:MAG: hypothetical protein M3247_05595, partial [Thermoproteota archaeon]|nr:hypothetical protein [Thermoproteota archaeon]
TISLSTPMIQLTSSALKSTSLVNRLLVQRFLGCMNELLPSSDQTIRAGLIVMRKGDNQNEQGTVLFESKRHVNLPQRYDKAHGLVRKNEGDAAARMLLFPSYQDIQTIIRSFYSMKQPLPDWIEFRNLVESDGYGSSPILSDNNIGLVNVDDRSQTIVHNLLTCQKNEIKVRKAELIIELMSSSDEAF